MIVPSFKNASPVAFVCTGIFVCFSALSFTKSKKTNCLFFAVKIILKPNGGLERGALCIV